MLGVAACFLTSSCGSRQENERRYRFNKGTDMLPAESLPVDTTEEPNDRSQGSVALKSAKEILSACDPISEGSTVPTGLINSQPQSNAAHQAGVPHGDVREPSCLRCGLSVPNDRLPRRSLSNLPASSVSVHSSRGGSRGGITGTRRAAATPADVCVHLLLACLWCQWSVLVPGLLAACSSCLNGLCSSCCHACARCCSAIQEVPVEEINCNAHCHSVLFESCCEPTECLEFCLECCEICHRS